MAMWDFLKEFYDHINSLSALLHIYFQTGIISHFFFYSPTWITVGLTGEESDVVQFGYFICLVRGISPFNSEPSACHSASSVLPTILFTHMLPGRVASAGERQAFPAGLTILSRRGFPDRWVQPCGWQNLDNQTVLGAFHGGHETTQGAPCTRPRWWVCSSEPFLGSKGKRRRTIMTCFFPTSRPSLEWVSLWLAHIVVILWEIHFNVYLCQQHIRWYSSSHLLLSISYISETIHGA